MGWIFNAVDPLTAYSAAFGNKKRGKLGREAKLPLRLQFAGRVSFQDLALSRPAKVFKVQVGG